MQPHGASNLHSYNFADYVQPTTTEQPISWNDFTLNPPAETTLRLPFGTAFAARPGLCAPTTIFDIGRIFDASSQASTIPLARIGVPALTRATIRGHDFVPLLLGTVFTTPGVPSQVINRLVPSLYEYETGQCFVLPASNQVNNSPMEQSPTEEMHAASVANTGYHHVNVAERIREIKWVEESDIFVSADGKCISTYKWSMDSEDSIMGGANLCATESNLHTATIRSLDTEGHSRRIITGDFDGQLNITALERSGQSGGHIVPKYDGTSLDSAKVSTGTILRQRRFPSVISSVSLFSGGLTGAMTFDDGSFVLIDTRSPRLISFQYDEITPTPGTRQRAPLYTHAISAETQAFLGYDGGEIRILDTRIGKIVARRSDSVVKAVGDLSISASGTLCATGYGGVSFLKAESSNSSWESQAQQSHVSTDVMGALETTSGAWIELGNGKSQFFVADSCGHLSVFDDPYE